MKTLESRIENLSNAQIEFFCNPRLPIGGQYIFGKNLKTGEIYNTIYYNLWDFNRNTALHEIGHGTQVLNGVSLFSEKAKLLYGKHINALVYKELCKNKKIPLIETLFGYFTDIMELGVRKNETERFLIKTGLKKVDEPVTKEHIKILMGLARLGLLPEGVAQFVLLYREEVLLEIFQTIAETRGRIQIIQKIADIESFLPKVRANKG